MANPTSNLLLLSGGAKVAIARIAQVATRKRGIELHISDTNKNVPSRHVAEQFHLLPKHTASDWKETLLQLCEKHEIGLLIPTRHSELLAVSEVQPELQKCGTQVSISPAATLEICTNKFDTYQFLKKEGFPTPSTAFRNSTSTDIPFPAIAKPNDGAASTGIVEVQSAEDLQNVPKNWILQEKAAGQEFTINVYVDKRGEVKCVVPHQRIIIEAGEVVQARTRRIEPLISLAKKIAERLPNARGILNIQAFYDEATGESKVIEINPRIGGGYPLCDAARGHYIEWLCTEFLDDEELSPFSNWTENLLMMRYRDATFSL